MVLEDQRCVLRWKQLLMHFCVCVGYMHCWLPLRVCNFHCSQTCGWWADLLTVCSKDKKKKQRWCFLTRNKTVLGSLSNKLSKCSWKLDSWYSISSEQEFVMFSFFCLCSFYGRGSTDNPVTKVWATHKHPLRIWADQTKTMMKLTPQRLDTQCMNKAVLCLCYSKIKYKLVQISRLVWVHLVKFFM